MCLYTYIQEGPEEKVSFLMFAEEQAQSGEDGRGGTTAPATALHCSQRGAKAGKWWAVSRVYPAQANCDMAQLYCPERVRSYAHAHMHTHTHI